MDHFRPIDRDTGSLMQPSVDEWLPERHLGRFVVEVVAGLDLRSMTGSYRGPGEAPYRSRFVLGILVDGYATGLFSSRKLERATYGSVAFRFIAGNIEAQLKAEVADLMARAEAADQADTPDGISIPDELARREERLARIAQARATIEARVRERHAREQAEHDDKMAQRAVKTAVTGKEPGGPVPKPPVEGPAPGDQVNLTDADSRIMQTPGHGFDQCYNAQTVVAAGSLLVVAAEVVQAPTHKQQLQPMLNKLTTLPEAVGKVETLLADTGYYSQANVDACAAAGIDPLIASARQNHHPSLAARFAPAPPPPLDPTRVEAMAHRMKTPEGKRLYGLRKQTPEPVFGIIKSVLGFRQFLLRGIDGARGEWSLVTMAWNMKRMFNLAGAS